MNKFLDQASDSLKRKLTLTLLVSSVALAGLTAYFMLWQLVRPYPLHSRETADIFGTSLLLRGQNPYSLETHPTYLYLYGIGSSLVCYPFAAVFGNSMILHRTVNDALVVLSCAVLYWGMRVSRVPAGIALCGALLFFSHIGYNDFSGAPDTLGLFLMFLSIVIPYVDNFSHRSVLAGFFLAILAFYTKEYFAIGAPLLVTYLFLFRSKAVALLLGSLFAIAMVASVWEVNRLLPVYFTDVFFGLLNGDAFTHSLRHELRVAAIYFPMCIGLVCLFIWRWWIMPRSEMPSDLCPPQLSWFDWQKPFVLRPPLHWVTFILVVCSAIWVLKLGQNGGNLMGYVYHLITPFLIWRACLMIGTEMPERIEPLLFFQATIVLVAAFLAIPMLVLHKKNDNATWQRVVTVVSRYHDVLNTGILSAILWDQGKPVYDAGEAEYYPLGISNNPSSITHAYAEQARHFQQMIDQKIRNKKFDAVMIFSESVPAPPVSRDLLAQYYRRNEIIPVVMPFETLNLEVWEPLPNSP